MDLADKVAVVTGGASGIGLALCRALARRGARVVVADVDLDGARAAAGKLEARGQAVHVDVTQSKSVEALVTGAVSAHGRLDYMFNNAGLAVVGDMRDLALDHWRKVIDTNLWGVVHGSHFAYRVMAEQGHGHIVNTASGFGLIPSPFNAPYATSKFAVVGLSETLRLEGADLGVRVSVACPGYVETSIFARTHAVNVAMGDLLSRLPIKMISADDAAARILEGVSKNEGTIVFPPYVKLLVGMHRLWPATALRAGLKLARALRERRGV